MRESIARRINSVLADPTGCLVASRLARMECRVKPLRSGDAGVLTDYETVFGAARFALVDVTASILDRAADLRARHRFKTPDAIHLATAIEEAASVFLTGDASLTRCTDMKVQLVSP